MISREKNGRLAASLLAPLLSLSLVVSGFWMQGCGIEEDSRVDNIERSVQQTQQTFALRIGGQLQSCFATGTCQAALYSAGQIVAVSTLAVGAVVTSPVTLSVVIAATAVTASVTVGIVVLDYYGRDVPYPQNRGVLAEAARLMLEREAASGTGQVYEAVAAAAGISASGTYGQTLPSTAGQIFVLATGAAATAQYALSDATLNPPSKRGKPKGKYVSGKCTCTGTSECPGYMPTYYVPSHAHAACTVAVNASCYACPRTCVREHGGCRYWENGVDVTGSKNKGAR